MAKNQNSSRYRDFILGFSKISISDLCKNNKISRSQIYNNELSLEKEIILKEAIEKEFAKLYEKM